MLAEPETENELDEFCWQHGPSSLRKLSKTGGFVKGFRLGQIGTFMLSLA